MLESTKGLSKIFGRDKNSLGNLLEGYIYSRWINWYVYYVRAFMQKVFPDPDVIIQSNIQRHDTNTRDLFFDHVFSMLPMLKERVISLNRLNRIRISNLTFDTMFFGSFGYVDWVFYKWLRFGKAYNLMDEVSIIIEILLQGSIKEITDAQPIE